MKQLLKEKKKIFLKKHNFYLVKDLSLVLLELPKANKIRGNFLGYDEKPTALLKAPPSTRTPTKKGRGQNINTVLSKNQSPYTWKPGQQQQHQDKYRPPR